MITQNESGLTAGDYSEFQDARTGSTYRTTLQRMSFEWTNLSGSVDVQTFDAAVSASLILRAVLAATTITVSGCTSEGSWSIKDTLSPLSGPVSPSLWASGDDVRLFYYDAGDLKWRVSSDGGATWGAGGTIGTLANVAWIAATSLTKLHVATYDNYNTRLHVYVYGGSWTKTDSNIYYPGEFGSFDAEPCGDYDVLAFDAFGQVRYDTARRGVWYIRHKDLVWGDPYEIDVLDEYEIRVNDRSDVLLETIDSKIFATYNALDESTETMCYSRSASGKFWQHRQPLGGVLLYKGKLLRFGNYTYFVCGDYLWRSASTPIVGHSTVEHDITDRITQYQGSQQKAYQSSMTIDNDDGSLVDLTAFTQWQITEEVGYFASDGDALLIQHALTLLDTVSVDTALPVSQTTISARDYMALLMDYTEADHYEEWESQLRHWDDFANVYDETLDKTILNSGMGHTATMEGYWSTVENTSDDEYELHLRSNNKTGLALCTVDKFIAHTIDQEAIMVPTADNNEWAGVVFRALDEDNYWLAYYDQATDKIHLRQTKSGVDQSISASTGALSWSVGTWYYIRVEARLSLFTVYYSTDGATWTQGFQHVDVSMGTDPETDLYAWCEGYVGHAGYGYSDEDTDPYEPDPYLPPFIPPNPDPYTIYDQFLVCKEGYGFAYAPTSDVVNATPPVWTACNGGLSTADDKSSYNILFQQERSRVYACTMSGLWYASLPLSGSTTWVNVLTQATIKSTVSKPSAAVASVQCLTVSWQNPEVQWAVVACGTYAPIREYFFITYDSWATVASYTEFPWTVSPNSTAWSGSIAPNRADESIIYATANDVAFGGGLYKSTDGGITWGSGPISNGGGWHRKNVVCLNMNGCEDHVYWIGSDSNTVWKSQNSGSSFTTESGGNHPERIRQRQRQYMMYFGNWGEIKQWNPSTDAFDLWFNVGSMNIFDLLCVGWGTNDALGYVIAAGNIGSQPALRRYDDYGGNNDLINNLNTVLGVGNANISAIGVEGGEWIE
jgi:hypothetical protein